VNILDLLDSKGIAVKTHSSTEISIQCPNAANHEGGIDENPSFNINIETLQANCFSCSFKLGEVGLTKWLMGEDLDEGQLQCLQLKGRLKRIESESRFELPFSTDEHIVVPPLIPFEEDYRGIRGETFKWLDVKKCEVGRYSNRLVAQIWMSGKLRGLDARSLGDEKPKYLRNAGAKAKEWLSFYDLITEMRPKVVLLVEGLFNSIAGLDRGEATTAYFGVNNWSNYKLLKILEIGSVSEICVFPDFDKAGLEAASRIATDLLPWIKVTHPDISLMKPGDDLEVLSRKIFEETIKNRREVRIK
jgi:DNA primase